jgi:hypothetical protein
MIKLKDILLENKAPHPFIPHKIEGRLDKLIQAYVKNGSKDNLDLSDMNLTKFPDVLKYVDVSGSFYCSNNQLKSLKGAPKSVDESFYCHNNQLTSLVGSPKSISGDFLCHNNQLTSLKGAPISVRDFWCSNNAVKFTKKDVRSICDVKGNIYL